MTGSFKRQASLIILLVAAAALFGLLSFSFQSASEPGHSVELKIAEYSPAGPTGGSVVPASCPSYDHNTGGACDCNGPTCEGDACFNIAGWQGGWDSNYLETYGVYRLCCTLPAVPLDTYTCGVPYSQGYYQGYYQSSYGPPDPEIDCVPSTINAGSSSTCTWNCDGTSTAGLGFSTGGALSGSVSVSPSVTTTYTVQCIDPEGTSETPTTVTVNHPALTISANPTRVRSGNASTITWSATQVTSCAISGPGFSGSGLSGSQSTGALNTQSVYTLTCQSVGGVKSASVTVSITPSQTEI